jgi:hypothetical protein
VKKIEVRGQRSEVRKKKSESAEPAAVPEVPGLTSDL